MDSLKVNMRMGSIISIALFLPFCVIAFVLSMNQFDAIVEEAQATEVAAPAPAPAAAAIPTAAVGGPPPVEYADGKVDKKFGKFRVVIEITPSDQMTADMIFSSIDGLCRTVLASSTLKKMKLVMVAVATKRGKKVKYKILKPPSDTK